VMLMDVSVFLSSFSPPPISLLILLLFSSRVHPCSWGVERGRVANEWASERLGEKVLL
jgi:hypothetical protein